MSDYRSLQKAIITKTLILAAAAGCLCLVLNEKAAAKGVALGGLFGVLDFKVMALLLPRRLLRRSRGSHFLSLFSRFFLLGIPLVIAIKTSSFNFAATVVGLLLVKAAVFCHFFSGRPRAAAVGLERGDGRLR